MKYNITYKDNLGTLEGVIENNFSEDFDNLKNYTLELKLGNILFKGDMLDGLELHNEDSYDDEQLNRFSFQKYEVYGTNEIIKELTDCKFKFKLQLEIADKQSFQISTLNGNLTILLGNFSPEEYSIFQYDYMYNNVNYSTIGDSFEDLFDNLKRIIKETHVIKNCYGCNYSDYSPFGRASFGDMLCFKSSKDKYLKIRNKSDFFQLRSRENQISVQETYCCDEFEFRKENVGYRG